MGPLRKATRHCVPPCSHAAAPTTGPRHLTPPPLPGPGAHPQSDFPNYSTRAAPAPSTRPRRQVCWVLGLPGGCRWSGSRRRGSSGARLLCKSCRSALPPQQAPAWRGRLHDGAWNVHPAARRAAGSIPHRGSEGQPCICSGWASNVTYNGLSASGCTSTQGMHRGAGLGRHSVGHTLPSAPQPR